MKAESRYKNISEPHKPKPGNRIYRVPHIITQRINLPKIRPPKPVIGVSLVSIIYGFGAMIVLGTLLLMLPVSSSNGHSASFITCLFTSTSAVCVTGLVVVDTHDYWSLFGQIVIVLLIQFGGLGFMTSTTVFLIASGRKIGLRGRILVGESVGVYRIGGVVRLALNILIFTLAACPVFITI